MVPSPRPFRLSIPDAAIADLKARLSLTRLPDQAPGEHDRELPSSALPEIAGNPAFVGAVTAAGLESSTDTSAQVLVAVTVQTSKSGAPPQPRSWRMRLTVQKAGDAAKVSNVNFVA